MSCIQLIEVLKKGLENTNVFTSYTQHTHKKLVRYQVPVAHVCNPSYSGGRDQEDHGFKPAQANSSQDPILKNPSQK
jgi:hypothetical protein